MGFAVRFWGPLWRQRTFGTVRSRLHPVGKNAPSLLPPTIGQLKSDITDEERFVVARGWVTSIRRHKNVCFVVLNDGSDSDGLQLVLSSWGPAESLQIGSSISAAGTLQSSPGRQQARELMVASITILGECPPEEYPIQKHELTNDYLRSVPHLRPRTSRFANILRLKSALNQRLRQFLEEHEVIEVQTPCVTFSDCEGSGETFGLRDSANFFGNEACLGVSGQLYAELAASSLGRVYTYGPVFRAEKHKTVRHLAEFSMLEVELSFLDCVQKLMDFAEAMIRSSLGALAPTSVPGVMQERYDSLVRSSVYPRLSYSEALSVLRNAVSLHNQIFTYPIRDGMSLQLEHERYLAEKIANGPIFIYDYPAPQKAFYMKSNGPFASRAEWEASTVASFDLLLPHVAEIVGGSLREHHLELLARSIEFCGLNGANYKWYLDLRRFGSVPHGGLGLGVDRLLQYLTCTDNIRDVVLVPRAAGLSTC